MNMQLHIQKMSKEDIDAVYAIESSVSPNPWSKDNFLKTFDAVYSYSSILKRDTSIRGYVLFLLIEDEVTILNIAVAQEFQGKGYGQMLLTHVHTFARNQKVKTAFLEVNEHNVQAIHFYIKQGYEIYSKRPKYYVNGDDALTMRYFFV